MSTRLRVPVLASSNQRLPSSAIPIYVMRHSIGSHHRVRAARALSAPRHRGRPRGLGRAGGGAAQRVGDEFLADTVT